MSPGVVARHAFSSELPKESSERFVDTVDVVGICLVCTVHLTVVLFGL